VQVQELRVSLGISLPDLVARARISHDMARKVDRGYVPKNVLVRESIANALGATEDELWPRVQRDE
jgi:hypothetical protein